MALDTLPRPNWLTDDIISEMRNDIAICPNPYTAEDIKSWQFDGDYDQKRLSAYNAIRTLNKYGIPLK